MASAWQVNDESCRRWQALPALMLGNSFITQLQMHFEIHYVNVSS